MPQTQPFQVGDRVRVTESNCVTLHYVGLLGTVCSLPGHGVTLELDNGPLERSFFNAPDAPTRLEQRTFQFNEVTKI